MADIKIDFWGETHIGKMFDIHDNAQVTIYAPASPSSEAKAGDNMSESKSTSNMSEAKAGDNMSEAKATSPSRKAKAASNASASRLAKAQNASPKTLCYYRHDNNGTLTRQRHRVNLLYQKWIEWRWIDPNSSPDDFDSLFEGLPRHCNIAWRGGSATLTILLQELLSQDYVTKQTGCSARAMVEGQFGLTPNSDRSRLDESTTERIAISLYILDLRNPLPERRRASASDGEDLSDAALHAICQGQLRLTKGI